MIQKMAPALLLASLAGCISFNPGTDPAPQAVQPVTPPGMKNGWVPSEAFTSQAPGAGPRSMSSPAMLATSQKSPLKAVTDEEVAHSDANRPPSRSVSDASDRAVALKGRDPTINRPPDEPQPEGASEESEAATSGSDSFPEETHVPGLPSRDGAVLTASVHRLVNSKRVAFDYEIKSVGPSGVSAVEVWCTRDGRSWKKLETVLEGKSPITVDVPEEGLYGFTLLARNGVGLGKRAPRTGEAPQVSVEVDLTRPVVRFLGAQPEGDAADRQLVVSWRAADRNLSPRPIALSYAERTEGPWEPIAARLENSGRYVWKLPPTVPLRFLVRVEATDLAGNVGVAQTPTPVLMDQSQPEISIRTVEPAGNPPRR